jgi:hypothetical protein
MPSKTIQLRSNCPATTTSCFLQLPNNGPAHFEQLCIPRTTASTGIQADNDRHSSLNDVTSPQAFSTMTTTMTATMTKVPAMTTAITEVPQIHFNKNKLTRTQQKTTTTSILHPVKMTANNATSPSLFLLCVEDNSEIIAPSLFLLRVKDNSAIMTETHEPSLLLLYVHGNQAIMISSLLLPYCQNNPSNNDHKSHQVNLYTSADCSVHPMSIDCSRQFFRAPYQILRESVLQQTI